MRRSRNPTHLSALLTVVFTNTTTGEVTGYEWAFGDGITDTVASPTRTYTGTGVYTVSLTAIGPGSSDTLTRTNYVTISGGYTTTTRAITYTYDPLNRLTGADYSTGETFAYAYDGVGNRTAMTTTTGTTTYTYDAANRLTSVDGVPYTWDARGNLLSDGTFTYAYNTAGRMVRAESVTVTIVYTYNAAGLRVAQSVDDDVTTFAWDWAAGVPEMLSEGGNLYLVGRDTLGQFAGDEWAYYLLDALGSVRQETDATGKVADSREWTPYGVEVGGAQAGLGYTGEWWDTSVGLEYLRARWYDGRVGRFTNKDPWKGDHLQPQSLHPYAYVENNAINLTDPSGQIPDGLVVGRVANFTGGIPFIKWLNAVYKLAGGCQLPHGEIFNVVGFGTETVYDFVHRQKQQFDIAYYGLDPFQLAGIELSFYEGLATGFQEVEGIANYAGLGLVKAPPAGLSLSAAILEAGGGISFVEAVERPGVDVIAVGFSLEFGVGCPGPALEEGATGVYWGLTAVAPVKNTFKEIQDLATLESEIRDSTSLITEIAIQSARFWWYWGPQQ